MTNTTNNNQSLFNDMVKAYEEFDVIVEAAKHLDDKTFILLMTLTKDEKLFYSAMTDLIDFTESTGSVVNKKNKYTFAKDIECVLITLSYMSSIGKLPKEVAMPFLYAMMYMEHIEILLGDSLED